MKWKLGFYRGLEGLGFPKIRDSFLGITIIRTIVSWGLYWGPLLLGNYPLLPTSTSTACKMVASWANVMDFGPFPANSFEVSRVMSEGVQRAPNVRKTHSFLSASETGLRGSRRRCLGFEGCFSGLRIT